ncbi:MAG: DUF4252 domain-containing protein [Saprospiraceae bacterium]|nr:DUF4252 domain-containing protein [Saprospiraceae bacterium]
MKRIVLFVFLGMTSFSLSAQNVIDREFAEYKSDDDYTKIQVAGKMFEMASDIEVQEDDKDMTEVKELISEIESFSMILGVEQENTLMKYKEGLNAIQGQYEELMVVSGKEGNFSFLINESNGIVYELVMIGASKDKFMVASLNGKMDLSRLGKISKRIQQGEFEPFSKMNEEGADEVKIYPNPSGEGQVITLEVPESMVGGTARVFDLSGQNIREWTISNIAEKMPVTNISEGRYLVEVNNGEATIRKKFVVQ